MIGGRTTVNPPHVFIVAVYFILLLKDNGTYAQNVSHRLEKSPDIGGGLGWLVFFPDAFQLSQSAFAGEKVN